MSKMTFKNIKKKRFDRYRQAALIGGPLVVCLIGIIVYLMSGRYVSTDNAYVKAALTHITANVSGQVTKIHVRNNAKVRKGDILFEIDERPFQLRVKEAEANFSARKLEIMALKATYQKSLAELQKTKNNLTYLQREFERQKKLSHAEISSKAQLDQTKNTLNNAYQQVEASQQQLANIRASLGEDPTIEVEKHPLVQQAHAALHQAQLNLSYILVKAPSDGIVTKVDHIQVGDYIATGTPVFSLVSDQDIWVEANFKETQLTYIEPGQKATIVLDVYPDVTFTGTVMSISPGTGLTFSLLPAENATGNWVKVVQRVPVRLSLDKKGLEVLRSGLSATVVIDTQHQRLKWLGR